MIASVVVVGSVAYVGYRLINNSRPTSLTTSSTPTLSTPAWTSATIPEPLATEIIFVTPTPTEQVKTTNNSSVSIRHNTTTQSRTPIVSKVPVVAGTNTSEQNAATRIVFLDLPHSVKSGESFTARWRIEGPDGSSGEKTTLKVSYETDSTSGSSRSATSSHNSQSFGSFTVPATFSTTLTYGGAGGIINLAASAEMAGQTITAERSVTLVD